jgi:tRNA-splicing ligase RtcB
MARHEHLPKELKHLAWLSLADADGQEYWAAMNLWACTPPRITRSSTATSPQARRDVILDLENHHNFAWKETHEIAAPSAK